MKKLLTKLFVMIGVGFTCTIFVLVLDSASQSKNSRNWMNKIDPALASIYLNRSSPIFSTKSLAKPDLLNVSASIPVIAKFLGVDATETDPIVRAMMKYDGEIDKLNALGIQVQSKIGNILTAHFPLSKLQNLAELNEVGYIEVGKPVELNLDASAPKVRAQEARDAFGYTGQNVIFGIVDAGMDITHQDFIKPDGTTRILYIWDQTLSPIAGESSPFGYSYGVEYTGANGV